MSLLWMRQQLQVHAWRSQWIIDLDSRTAQHCIKATVFSLHTGRWVDDASAKIQITAAGKQVRAEVEAETERLFFAPWSSLNESELEELSSLANQLRDGLKQ